MSASRSLDLIVPCFNPRPGWEEILINGVNELKQTLPKEVLQAVILVNDGSKTGVTDSGVEQLISAVPELKLIEYKKNRGKGYAVRSGVKSGESEIQIYTDIDVPYTAASVLEFYNTLAENKADVVVSSRGLSYYDSLSGFRKILSKSLRWLNGFLFRLKIKDTQGGLKGFNSFGRELFLRTKVNRYLFDLEFVRNVSQTDLKIKAVEVQLKPDIVLPSPSPMILLKEMHNFIRLLFFR